MKQHITYQVSLVFLLFTAPISTCFANELRTAYATIIYEQEDRLSQFNKKISIKDASNLKKNAKILSDTEAIRYKVDSLIEKIEILLHVWPRDFKLNLRLLNTTYEVQKYYKVYYGNYCDYIAFYCPRNKTVFLSVNNIDEYVLVHELTHAVLDQYFLIPPSAIIQEILSHFVETHIDF